MRGWDNPFHLKKQCGTIGICLGEKIFGTFGAPPPSQGEGGVSGLRPVNHPPAGGGGTL